ncbi:hypothetical protein DICPUDRAFT_94882 [Dictyostelium purpureum]|uniref:DUF7906 domain-containing protein n=1 Tax=Dictyostelium purpureum TaxID=5786 RepID=F0ZPP0_DICPU|nr:uncharacterized protein DICPUDRAFT_94882 [Dictyostelium purpureum]EGC34086.1 hypothetical protein DICPUDRAFT_94882 [Dictyostelium purpureum]|eukprot:XP_003289379.1 hypothetical protein DICPUDRAFT_94882 [Dictyostelium purpureum]
MPTNIQVILIGFDSNGAYEYSLPPDSLYQILTESYPIHYSHSIEKSNYLKNDEEEEENTNNNNNNNNNNNEDILNILNKRLITHYDLKYNIVNAPKETLERYEQLLQLHMKPLSETNQESSFDGETHLVPIEGIETFIENEINKTPKNTRDYTVVLVNPNKDRVLKEYQVQNPKDRTPSNIFKYQFTMDNRDVISPVWVGSGRFVVVDLSAGPLKYGTTLHKSSDELISEGSIDYDSIPRLVEYFLGRGYSGTSLQGASPIEIAAHISTIIINCIQNVFLFDTKYDYIPLFQKILIPILIFKDTDEIKIQDQLMDLNLIKSEAKRLFPFSEVNFVVAEHSLHEHKHISMAFSKSIKSHTSFEMDPKTGLFTNIIKSYIDSKELLLRLKTEDDILAAGLIGSETTQIPESLQKSKRNTPSQKSKILPIYMFSLLKSPSNLLLDKYYLHSSDQDAIVVLQTNHSFNSTLYKGNKQVEVNSLTTTNRNIIAGIAESQGLMGPTIKYSEAHGRLINNFLWGFGHHPFGFFSSNNSRISQIFIDGIIRNTIITSVQSSEINLKSAFDRVSEFTQKYLLDSLGFEIKDTSLSHGNFLIDRLYHAPPNKLPILKSIVARLHDDLDKITFEIKNQIVLIPSFLSINKELNKFQRDKISQDLVLIATQVSGFLDYVEKEISNVENQLLCCAITRGSSKVSSTNRNLSILILVFAALVTVILYRISQNQSTKKKPLLINRRGNLNKK